MSERASEPWALSEPSALRVGIVGAGNISGQYSTCLARLPQLQVRAVCDLRADRAEALAAQHDGARVLGLPELLAAPDVDAVLALTLPSTHADVALAALAAGKHVYVEKPLAGSVAEGREVVKAAAAAGLRVGCAPDTVLGTGVQTARAVVDAGRIGTPHAATAFMTTPGHERWHPDPEFYYQPGGGPLLDMGPYYLTSLVHLLGPVVRVTGASARPSVTRTIGKGPRAGESFDVTVDSTITGVLEHASGALSTLIMSFDIWAARLPRIEVHGTGGSLSVPDPNHFDGPVELFSATAPDEGWVDVGVEAGYLGAGRGHGLADLALALADDRPHRAGDELGLHVLEIMESVQQAADDHTSVELTTTCHRPEPVAGVVDLTV
ncbi:Gfo/Idh/MocA family protein [Pseudonocardia kunmingensis]|uniref:Putative dehydrogenase n=1 Tax=Pseudonocardia kunmingensis TaxID=630975 RepID=A0A543DRS5_9PSEU|nr:Gfo/Idh/MocA family oxidoreductase [Pseudonocardia kunmingensis]TQM12012.1 putative dehydrogenase [Pseudonocardia kunmingensis]